MKLVKPSHKIMFITPNPLKLIEKAGRICYISESKITPTSAEAFTKRIRKSGHHSVIEHGIMTVKFICDRGVLVELTRHRLSSFSVESSRYCNYNKGLTFVIPPWLKNLVSGNELKELFFEDIVDKVGPVAVYEFAVERNFIMAKDKDKLFEELEQNFFETLGKYISKPNFPKKLILKQYKDRVDNKTNKIKVV